MNDPLTYKYHHDPDYVDRQVPLFGVRVQQVEHDGRYNEEKKAAYLQEKQSDNQSITIFCEVIIVE